MLPPLPRAALAAAAMLTAFAAPGNLAAQIRNDAREASRAGRAAPGKPTIVPSTKGQPELKLSVSADGTTLYLAGMLLDGAFHQVDAILRAAPKVQRVHLSSSGGFTIEGRLVAALVRKYRLDTYVEYYCASACTQVFAAGQQRVIGPQAKLGFHQAVMVDGNGMTAGVRERTDRKLDSTTVFGVNGNDTLRLAYELAGTKPTFIDKALAYDYENMWLPSQEELLESGLVLRVAEQSEVPPPDGAVARDAIRSAMLEQPLWRAAQERFPDLTEQALGDVWRIANSGFSLREAAQSGRSKLVTDAMQLLPAAEDTLLEQALSTYARAARSQRARGYPGCHSDTLRTPQIDPEDAEFAQKEDALVTDLLQSPQKAKVMKAEAAARYFSREVAPLLAETVEQNSGMEQGGLCRIGFDTFEAIDSLPRNKRIKAYRALLSMPHNSGN